ncbi:MAG: hypothetical protein NWF00_10930 [Candidatus Bathyarchaeota archaeon]|nr:hypothetical protein [Candidatus Bathyarchaeota archaeon]
MANLKENLNQLMEATEPFTETITEDNGKVIIKLKREAWDTAKHFIAFRDGFYSLLKELRLESYVTTFFDSDKDSKDEIPPLETIRYQIDKGAIFSDQLKGYFRKDTSREDVSELLNFLASIGWTEDKFQSEIGISKITLYRYQTEKPSLSEIP